MNEESEATENIQSLQFQMWKKVLRKVNSFIFGYKPSNSTSEVLPERPTVYFANPILSLVRVLK